MTTSDAAGPSAGPTPGSLVDALVQTAFVTMAVLTRVGAAHDLSLTQLRALAILRDRRVRMRALADYLGLDKSTMSGLVDRAERRGLLRRTPDPTDGRAVAVTLTPDGAALAEQVAAEVSRALAPRTGALAPADAARLTTLLRPLLEGP